LHTLLALIRKLVSSIKSSSKQNGLFFGEQAESFLGCFLDNMGPNGELDEDVIVKSSNVNLHIASLIGDMAVRWMSTHDMLERLFKLRHHLNNYFKSVSMKHYVSMEIWNIISQLLAVLKPFKELTLKLQERNLQAGDALVEVSKAMSSLMIEKDIRYLGQ
jgi:hypothetical protein